jgi:AMMECR1 domain-containing protein
MRFGYGTDLLEQLRPGLDALIIEDGPHRALLLPAMWRQLSDSRQFLGQLKHKAGCPPITGHSVQGCPLLWW